MNVTLEAISFNHQPNSATNDAFSIRRNASQPVNLPEWPGASTEAKDSPAAYACKSIGKNDVTIKARFRCSDKTLQHIWIKAIDGHPHSSGATNILGTVPVTKITLDKGQSDDIPITLDNVRIAGAGVSASDVIWGWQFSLNASDWTELVTTTHRIYAVLRLPTLPWEALDPSPTNIQVPWTEVLELACARAAGAQDVDVAAGMITEDVNALGSAKVKYNPSPSFAREGTDKFLLTKFLALINSSPGVKKKMNCSDCATAVSTFANILGASLSQSSMGYLFVINHVRRIGQGFEDGGSFNIHEVAWKGDCTEDDALFDACLHLDGDSDPETNPFDPLLPKNIPFADYLLRLKRKNVGNACVPDPQHKRHRKFEEPLTLRRTTPRQLTALNDFYHFTSWKTTRLSDEYLFIWRSFPSGDEVPGWHMKSTQRFTSEEGMPKTIESWWATNEDSGQQVRVNNYECVSLEAAHMVLLTILGGIDVPYMKREAETRGRSFGDVAFMNLQGTSLLFARGNMVITAEVADTLEQDLGNFLYQFDSDLEARPDSDPEIDTMDRFRLPEFFTRDRVPVEFRDDDPDQETKYKFFSESGQIVAEGEKLFYLPDVAGRQHIDVFGIGADRKVKKQRLKILIEEK